MIDVSIYIPCYNGAHLLRRCLDSVVAQNLDNIECIVVDDGSTDNIVEVFNDYKYGSDGTDRYSWLQIVTLERNSGISIARNTGIQCAKGRYVCGLDVDDTLPDGAIKALIDAAHEFDYPDMVLGSYNMIFSDHVETITAQPIYLEGAAKIGYNLLMRNIIWLWSTHWGKLIKREWFLQDAIGYRPGLAKVEDTECLTRLLPTINTFCSISEPVYNYFIYDGTAMTRYKGRPQIEANERLWQTRREVVDKLFLNEEYELLGNTLEREMSFLYLSTIYVIYNTNGINRYEALKDVCRSIEGINPNWKHYFETGNPRIIRMALALGYRPTHWLLSFVSAVPQLRKRLRG